MTRSSHSDPTRQSIAGSRPARASAADASPPPPPRRNEPPRSRRPSNPPNPPGGKRKSIPPGKRPASSPGKRPASSPGSAQNPPPPPPPRTDVRRRTPDLTKPDHPAGTNGPTTGARTGVRSAVRTGVRSRGQGAEAAKKPQAGEHESLSFAQRLKSPVGLTIIGSTLALLLAVILLAGSSDAPANNASAAAADGDGNRPGTPAPADDVVDPVQKMKVHVEGAASIDEAVARLVDWSRRTSESSRMAAAHRQLAERVLADARNTLNAADPVRATDLASLARHADALGLPDIAQACWRDVIAVDPDDMEAREACGFVRFRLSRSLEMKRAQDESMVPAELTAADGKWYTQAECDALQAKEADCLAQARQVFARWDANPLAREADRVATRLANDRAFARLRCTATAAAEWVVVSVTTDGASAAAAPYDLQGTLADVRRAFATASERLGMPGETAGSAPQVAWFASQSAWLTFLRNAGMRGDTPPAFCSAEHRMVCIADSATRDQQIDVVIRHLLDRRLTGAGGVDQFAATNGYLASAIGDLVRHQLGGSARVHSPHSPDPRETIGDLHAWLDADKRVLPWQESNEDWVLFDLPALIAMGNAGRAASEAAKVAKQMAESIYHCRDRNRELATPANCETAFRAFSLALVNWMADARPAQLRRLQAIAFDGSAADAEAFLQAFQIAVPDSMPAAADPAPEVFEQRVARLRALPQVRRLHTEWVRWMRAAYPATSQVGDRGLPTPVVEGESKDPEAEPAAVKPKKRNVPLPQPLLPVGEAVDRYLDQQWDKNPQATESMVAQLEQEGWDIDRLEAFLLAGRATYPDPPQPAGATGKVTFTCDHTEHSAHYYIYVPAGYDKTKAWPLMFVGHGGNSAMQDWRADATARDYHGLYQQAFGVERDYIVVTPATTRGWGWIGNSMIMSCIAKVSREYHVDPHRVSIGGQSMGGHMSWRTALTFPERFATVMPMSGGYTQYIENDALMNAFNVRGYATWGVQEPYGINDSNKACRDVMQPLGYSWKFEELPGNHPLPLDALRRMSEWAKPIQRNPYPVVVASRRGGTEWAQAETNQYWPDSPAWNPDRPIPHDTIHWLRVTQANDDEGQALMQKVVAKYAGDNTFEIAVENAKTLTVMLHPCMVRFSQPITINVNGKRVFRGKVKPSMETLLDHVRHTGDRGLIYHASVTVEAPTSQPVTLAMLKQE